MPTTSSPFSIVGMLIGSRRTAALKRKGKQDSKASSVVDVRIKDEPHITNVEEAQTQVVAEKNEPKPAPPVEESSDGYESSTDEHLYSAALPPPASHTDHDWTDVATQEPINPSHASSSASDETPQGPNAAVADDISSTSSESFDEDTLQVKREVSTSLEEFRLPAEVAALRKDVVDIETELERVLRELDATEQLNQDLKEEDRRRLSIMRKNDEELQSIRKEKMDAESRLRKIVAELEVAGQLNRELNDKNSALGNSTQALEKAVQGVEMEKSRLVGTCDRLRAELDTALQRHYVLEDEKRGHEDEIQGLKDRAEALEAEKLRTVEQLDAEKREHHAESHRLEERLREVESDMRHVQQQLEDAHRQNREGEDIKAQLTMALQRNRELEEYKGRIGDEIAILKDTLRDHMATTQQTEDERGRQREELQGKLRALEQERDQITKRLEEILTLHQELKERCKRLVDEHEEKEQLLRGLKETHIKATNRLRVTRTDLEEAEALNDALQKQSRYQANELQAKDKKIRSLEASLAEMAKLQDQRQSESADRRIRMLEDQMRRQTSELNAVKNQTRSAASYRAGPIRESQSGVIGLVDTLNTEIFQAAAFMADSLEYKSKESMTGIDVKEAIERAGRTMGKPMVLVLRSRLTQNEVEFDPLPIQIALQACMVTCCVKIMASWYPGHWEYADFLATIYSRIQGSGASITVIRR